jgi:putative membrane protein
MESLSTDVEDAKKALDQMSTLVQGMQSELPADLPAKLKALTAALEQAAKASESISQGIETVDAALGQVESGSKNALEQVYTGTSTLVSQNAQLTNGMETLNASTEQLASQKDTFHQMADGLQSLEDALTKLNEGANTLYEGQSRFNQEGIMKLASAVNLGVGEVDALKSIINNIQILNDENRSFAGAPDGANTKVRFVYRTEGQE